MRKRIPRISARNILAAAFVASVLALAGVGYHLLEKFADSREIVLRKRQQKYRQALAVLAEAGAGQPGAGGLALPAAVDMPRMLAQIERLVSQHELRVSDTKPQTARTKKFISEVSVSLVIDGRLNEILAFLNQCEQEPNNFLVKEFCFRKSFFNNRGVRVQIVLSLLSAAGDQGRP